MAALLTDAIAGSETQPRSISPTARARTGGPSAAGSAGSDVAGSAAEAGAPGSAKSEDRGPSTRERLEEPLIAEYGEVRTNLSRKVAGDVVLLLDDVIAMGEAMAEGRTGQGWNLA